MLFWVLLFCFFFPSGFPSTYRLIKQMNRAAKRKKEEEEEASSIYSDFKLDIHCLTLTKSKTKIMLKD